MDIGWTLWRLAVTHLMKKLTKKSEGKFTQKVILLSNSIILFGYCVENDKIRHDIF